MSDESPAQLYWTKRRAVWVILAHLVVLPFALYAFRGLTMKNNVAEWLPDDDPYARVLTWFSDQFGVESGLLASWDGATLNDPRVEAFAAALAGPADEDGQRHGHLDGIKSVQTPRDVIRRMLGQNIPREDALRRIRGLLVGTGPLKVQLTEAGRAEREAIVATLIDRAADEMGIEVVVLPPGIDAFAEGAAKSVADSSPSTGNTPSTIETNEFSGPGADDPYPAPPPHDFQLRWNDMVPQAEATLTLRSMLESLQTTGGESAVAESFFSLGAPAAVAVTLTEEGDERADAMMALVRSKAVEAGIPEETLHMGGSPVGRAALNESSSKASWNRSYPWWNLPQRSPVLTSALVGLGTSLIVLRSVRLAMLVIATALYIAVLTTSLVPMSGRSINMVLLVMPNLLIVLTTSGAIHVANYWRHAARENPHGAIATAVRMAWQPCVLASFTTAIGLTSLLTSVLSPVQEFGAFSAIGCLLSVVAVLMGFPALLTLWRGGIPMIPEDDHAVWKRLGHWLYRHGTWVSVVCLSVFVGSVIGLRYFTTETKVIKYFPEGTRVIADYRFLEENLAGIVPVDVVVSFDTRAIEENDSIRRLEMVRRIKMEIAAHPEISGTLALSDFRPQTDPLPENAPRMKRVKYNRIRHALDDYLTETVTADEARLTTYAGRELQLTYSGRDVDIPQGAELWRIRAQVAVLSDLNYNDLTDDLDNMVSAQLADSPGTTHVVTGMVPLFLRTQEAVLESLIESFALAFAIIAVILMILLRNPAAGLITMLPNLMPVGVVFGLISWASVPVDIGTMITASVALGIAIDGTLHLLTWFRNGLRDGMSREDAIALGLAHCGPAMWQTSLAIGLGLLMLAFAELLLISRFGWLMAALIAAALIADIILLPALLAGPLGTLIEKNNRPNRNA